MRVPSRARTAIWIVLIVAAAISTACSGDADESSGDEPTSTSTVVDSGVATTSAAPTGAFPTSESPITTTRAATTMPTSTTPADPVDVAPVVRVPETVPADAGFNMGILTMSADLVELWWTPFNGAAQDHRLHRLPLIGTNPVDAELSDDNLVYQGTELGFADLTAPQDEFVLYILEIVPDGEQPYRAWASALTVDDTTPPAPIENLVAEITPDGVLLSWSPSSDEVEFAAYGVFLVGADGQNTYLGGGTEPSQSRFLDDRPASGTNVYLVQAADFHDNRTSATVEIVAP